MNFSNEYSKMGTNNQGERVSLGRAGAATVSARVGAQFVTKPIHNYSGTHSPIAREVTSLGRAHKLLSASPSSRSPTTSKLTSYECQDEFSGTKFRNKYIPNNNGKLGTNMDDGPGNKLHLNGFSMLQKLSQEGCICIKKAKVNRTDSQSTVRNYKFNAFGADGDMMTNYQSQENLNESIIKD